MKKILALFVSVCLAVGIAGCGTTIDVPIASTKANDATPSQIVSTELNTPQLLPAEPSDTMHSVSLPIIKETIYAEDGTALFSLSRQNVLLTLDSPVIAEAIMADLLTRSTPFLENASHIESQAKADYQDNEFWSEYFIDISYTPLRLDRSVLSLFGNYSSYAGGPHPSFVTDSVTYDLNSGEMVYLDDILSPSTSTDTLFQLLKKQLEPQKDDLYYDYEDALLDRFTGELHSIRDWYFSRSGLCFHFAPYDIAPYSSGTIIAEIPYNELSGVLLDKYIPVEIQDATGSMYAEAYIDDDIERFTSIVDIPLVKEGLEVLLYPDATVTDVRIEIGTRYSDTEQYMAISTVFAADTMNIGNAIHLIANLADNETVLRLIYRSDGQEYSAFIAYDSIGDTIMLTHG